MGHVTGDFLYLRGMSRQGVSKTGLFRWPCNSQPMKNYGSKKPAQLSEREKLRKFSELDDAFARALRELDAPGSRQGESPPEDFEQRLRTLMADFHQSEDSVRNMLSLMLNNEAG
ncbi:hypothetical protein [Modicisalibacter tunisiensis]|uniref:hypothetical protein n=1 Tax=Modicisalibacter tunisiensis TaxID=390637 RepID=UPI001CCA4BC0|nr:hypothetical protein [Modicisalibacter tunisiensis]